MLKIQKNENLFNSKSHYFLKNREGTITKTKILLNMNMKTLMMRSLSENDKNQARENDKMESNYNQYIKSP